MLYDDLLVIFVHQHVSLMQVKGYHKSLYRLVLWLNLRVVWEDDEQCEFYNLLIYSPFMIP